MVINLEYNWLLQYIKANKITVNHDFYLRRVFLGYLLSY